MVTVWKPDDGEIATHTGCDSCGLSRLHLLSELFFLEQFNIFFCETLALSRPKIDWKRNYHKEGRSELSWQDMIFAQSDSRLVEKEKSLIEDIFTNYSVL